jgi:photosystem II stability/assembly factor-like uncharacterized protein
MTLRFALTSIFIISLFSNAFPNWQPSQGPYGGAVENLVISGDLIVAGCYSNAGGIFVSENGGAKWNRVTKTDRPTHLTNNFLVNGIVQKGSESIFYVATVEGLYKLFKGGSEWELKSIGFNFMALNITDITFIEGNLFISVWEGGIKRSQNEGQSWMNVNNGLDEMNVASLNFSGDTILAGTVHGLFYSINSGNTWSVFSDLLKDSYIIKVLVDDKHICATEFSAGAFVFDKSGKLITRSEPVAQYHNTILPFALIDGYLYGQFQNKELYRSPVNEISWVKITEQFNNTKPMVLVKKGTEFILATGGYDGVYKSGDQGATWISLNEGFKAYEVNAIATAGDKVYMATDVAGLFVSNDLGFTWNSVGNQPPGYRFNDILVKDGVIFLAGYGLFISLDNGSSWRKADSRYFTSLATNGQTIYAASLYEGLISSQDQGVSWQEEEFPYKDNLIYCIAAIDSIVAVGTHYDGLYISKDNGNTWETNKNLSGLSVQSIALKGRTIFIATGCGLAECSKNSGVYSSMNLGETWQYKNYGLGYSIVKVLVKKNIIYGYFTDKVVYSRDNAMTWEYFGGDILQAGGRLSADGEQIGDVQSMNVSDSYIYVATSGGIYLRENNIETVLGLDHFEDTPTLRSVSIYPNPVANTTTFSLTLDQYEPSLNISIFDTQGRVVYKLNHEQNNPGTHTFTLDASDLSPGTYLARINTRKTSECRKLIVLR